jgi:hypothetical protein
VQQDPGHGNKGRLCRCVCACVLVCPSTFPFPGPLLETTRDAATPAAHIYADRKRTIAFTSHVTELARIKNTPTDAELATQIDEVESKVRVRCPSYHVPHGHDPPLRSNPRLPSLNRSRNFASTSSLCVRGRPSSQPPSSTCSTPSG